MSLKPLKNIADTLTWFEQMGVDETISDFPINQFKTVKKEVANNEKKQTFIKEVSNKTNINSVLQSPDVLIEKTRNLANKANSLEELNKIVTSFNELSICKTATNIVFGDGNPKSDVMLIGEAPGADEDLQGIPFCGASGKLLEQTLNAIGLYREKNYYITNTVFWRPPGNRKPTTQELEICLPFVEKHIALVQPKVIILVGATAIISLLKSKEAISKLRGKFVGYKNNYMEQESFVTPIFHPSYLLRSPGQKKLAWHDLLIIDQFIAEKGIKK